MPDMKELAREIALTKEKLRRAEDTALAERRRQQELAAADAEARSVRRATRGF
jgi:hypothetical protein